MTGLRAVSRIAAMDRRELRFRLACEARNAVGRFRFTVNPPRLNRSRLARVLDRASGSLVSEAIDAARRADPLTAHPRNGVFPRAPTPAVCVTRFSLKRRHSALANDFDEASL